MNEKQQLIIESYIKSYNDFDLNGMLKDLSKKVIFENISNGKVALRTVGIFEFKKQAALAKEYFSERKQTIESWEFNHSKVIVEIDYKAMLAIDLPNGMKKGEKLELKGKSEFEFENGKIITITDKS